MPSPLFCQCRPHYLWFQLAEQTYDTYMMIQQRKGLV